MTWLVPRIRFSLRTFLVALLVLSLIGSNLYVSWKWRQTQIENWRLRDELGILTIEDPTQFYVREARGGGILNWRWRIYAPPGQRKLYVATSRIADKDCSGGQSIVPPHPPQGEYTLTAHVEPNHFGWALTVLYPGGGEKFHIMPPHADWVPDCFPKVHSGPVPPRPPRRIPIEIEVAGRNQEPESFAGDEPVVLLRLRAPTPEQAAKHEDCDGIMLWFK
jgi:hypothetical protein